MDCPSCLQGIMDHFIQFIHRMRMHNAGPGSQLGNRWLRSHPYYVVNSKIVAENNLIP